MNVQPAKEIIVAEELFAIEICATSVGDNNGDYCGVQ